MPRNLLTRSVGQRLPGKRVSSLRWIVGVMALYCLPLYGQIEVTDDLGNPVILREPAQRIISLSPHITETLFAVGAGDRIVATVQFSNYPEAASAIPVIGSFSEISYESLLSLDPDLVIVWASGNGEEIIARIRSLGLTVYLDEPRQIEDVARSLRRFGVLTANEDIAGRAAEDFLNRLAILHARELAGEPVRVFYEVWNEPLTTLNGEHLVSDIIRLCGGENVFSDAIPLAPVISTESVLAADPQLIVVSGMDEERPEWLDEWRQWPGLTAAEINQLRFIPPDLLQRNAPRIIQGAEMMCEYVEQARAAARLN
ncbi:MAG: cobalamin-binding protein [Proteobacteria bacterium]|nr:cobalamin-binding protein [Pseudomonadota bacterium]MDA0927673.1 cobalamin-binding protein [Pseudomonadota bacterium]